MVDMTEEEKMMLHRLIVKEDELEELQEELGRTRTNADYGTEWMRKASLEARVTRLSREVEELKDKLREICGE